MQGGKSLPTDLPAQYQDNTGATRTMSYKGGMTVANIMDWCTYLTVTTFSGAGGVVGGTDTASTTGAGDMGTGGGIEYAVSPSAGEGY